ncbi:hypothetical protein EZV62_007911 [Acer yangbiense]|uniref:C2 domain-containing protein n=1 Tax=Acer yangbiense TaxID=1000413 RepID=A0A5C7IE13_9ROSI|nr:hypothetical protein EZV62_007911 [Acer yangbiense]
MTSIMEISIMHHVCIVLLSLWFLSAFNLSHPLVYFVSLIYLYLVHERYVMRLRRKLQFEERKQSNQRRVLSDSETVRWLNNAVEKMWPICMEQIVSQKILLPIIPWFLEKYKPWTAKQAVVQHLYMGRNPPMFTEMRVLRQNSDDDHLVLELGMNFLTADDMSAILAVKLRKRLGFGMWAKLHLTGMHVEGKVLIGVKFLRRWPFLGRLRVCFVEPPYFQMTVKPIFTHGLDVTELPGIAGWLDKLLSIAFEQTLVEPNMLVVDVEKFASPESENWFSVDVKEPVAYAKVEVVEASDMKPSDLNGLADPYVKGQLGPYRFRTKTHKKTLTPKWHEEFKIPICTWESPNILLIEVRDKDRFVDDTLGDCSINISDLRDGQRHDMWLPLENIKMGRLHLAVKVLEDNAKGVDDAYDEAMFNKEGVQNNEELRNKEDVLNSFAKESSLKGSFSSVTEEKSPKVVDNFEPINIEGQQETGIWVHHPGSDVVQTWEPRKGKTRTQIHRVTNDSFGSPNSAAAGSLNNGSSSSSDDNHESKKPMNAVRRGLRMIGSVFNRSPKSEDHSGSIGEVFQSPHANLKAVNTKEIGMKFIVEDSLSGPITVKDLKEINVVPGPVTGKDPKEEISVGSEGSGPESPGKGNMKGMAKSILKHAEKHARHIKHALSRKGSRRFQGDSSGVTEQDISLDGDSSDNESLSSPRVERVPPVSNPQSPCSGNDYICNTKEYIVQTGSSDPAMEIEGQTKKKSVEDQEQKDDDEVSKPNRSGNGEIESSKTNILEEDLRGREDYKVGIVENKIS